MDGRLFIKYITLNYLYANNRGIMRDKKLFEKYSIQELLRVPAKIKITYTDYFDPIKAKSQKNKVTFSKLSALRHS
jgi:hypothetical protein